MKTMNPLSAYFISGVWYDQGMVSHYALHLFHNPGISVGKKHTKDEVIAIVENSGLPVYVCGWDYKEGRFKTGERVICYNGQNGKFLWTESKNESRKNLQHLIKYNWITE